MATPRDPRAQVEFDKGLTAGKSAQWPAAITAFQACLRYAPADAETWYNLMCSHIHTNQKDMAIGAGQRAAQIDPKFPNLQYLLGNTLFEHGKPIDAVHHLLCALEQNPQGMITHTILANVFERLKLFEESYECFGNAIRLGGERSTLYSAMVYQAGHACRFDLAVLAETGLRKELAQGRNNAAPFQLFCYTDTTRTAQRDAGLKHWNMVTAGVKLMDPPPERGSLPKIRIGYMTSDIFNHATAFLIAELFEHHDRNRFDVFLYSYGHDDGSEIRNRIKAILGDRFVEMFKMSDDDMAQRVRADDIDILVDMKGYTQGTHNGVFARRPARIQVNYLGYPGTTGSPCIDYIIGDPIVTPLEHAADYSEKIAQMPHCYQPNDRKRPIGPRPMRAECGLPEKGFIFCSFNNCYKITAPVFNIWCRLLLAVPGSALWLYEANVQARRNLLREAQQLGIASDRIVWAPHVSIAEHLGRLQLADLALDTFPVTSHTTASDALWAGVPIITKIGQSFVSRVAASILYAAGLPDLVTNDDDEYERLALALARNPEWLRSIRNRLAYNRDTCPLFDSERYARDLEALFEKMMSQGALAMSANVASLACEPALLPK